MCRSEVRWKSAAACTRGTRVAAAARAGRAPSNQDGPRLALWVRGLGARASPPPCAPLWSAAGVHEAALGGGAGFGVVWSLVMLPDGRLAAGCISGIGGIVRIWDVQRRALDVVIRGHTDTVWALVPFPDGRLLSGSGDRTLKVWDERALSVQGGADTDACAATLEGHTGRVAALAVLPDRSVVSGSGDGTVRGWR